MFGRAIGVVLVLWLVPACASRAIVLDLQGSIIYESPRITGITHSISDGRPEGGTVVVRVELTGDPGLTASFDITPQIAKGEPMTETTDGRYSREFAFPPDLTGGPFTIIGRLRHEEAGEVTMRDPEPITISLAN